MDTPIRVLFMQSQSYFGSDSVIHGLLMRSLDRDRFEVYAACTMFPGETYVKLTPRGNRRVLERK